MRFHLHMQRASVWVLRARISWLMALCVAASAATGQTSERDQLIAESAMWLKSVGSVLLTYEQETTDGRGAGRRTVGFDAATGAWFVADHASGASGLTTNGSRFQLVGADDMFFATQPALGKATDGPQGDNSPPHVSSGPDGYIPIVLIANMRTTSVGLRSVERDEEGNWVISHEGRTGDPNLKRLTRVTFDAEGRPLRYHADVDPTTKREEVDFEFEIEPQSPPGLAIVKQRQISPRVLPQRLVDVQYYPVSRPELFTMESANAIATDNRIQTQVRLAQISATHLGGGAGPQPALYARTTFGRIGWPLIVTGIVVVGLGIFALFRSRIAT